MFALTRNLWTSRKTTGRRTSYMPRFEALERREVMSVATSAILTAPVTPVLANGGSVLANQGITPRPATLGSVSNVEFNGNTAVEVASTPAPQTLLTLKTVQTLNVKDELLTLYQQNLPQTAKLISDYLSNPAHTDGYNLYDIRLNLAFTLPNDDLFLSVDSQHDSFTLNYIQSIPSYLDCKVPNGIPGVPDPSMNVEFYLQLVMTFTTSGPPGNPANGPVALQSATIHFADPIVHIDGDFVSSSDVAKAQAAFERAQGDATAALNQDLAPELLLLNSALMSYAPQAVVTPSYDAANAQFDLIVSSGLPSTAPHASALAQPGSPMSTTTTLVSSASQSPVSLQTDLAAIDIVMAQGAVAKKQVNADAAGSLF